MFVILLSDWLNIHFFSLNTKFITKTPLRLLLEKRNKLRKASRFFFEILIAQAINTKWIKRSGGILFVDPFKASEKPKFLRTFNNKLMWNKAIDCNQMAHADFVANSCWMNPYFTKTHKINSLSMLHQIVVPFERKS